MSMDFVKEIVMCSSKISLNSCKQVKSWFYFCQCWWLCNLLRCKLILILICSPYNQIKPCCLFLLTALSSVVCSLKMLTLKKEVDPQQQETKLRSAKQSPTPPCQSVLLTVIISWLLKKKKFFFTFLKMLFPYLTFHNILMVECAFSAYSFVFWVTLDSSQPTGGQTYEVHPSLHTLHQTKWKQEGTWLGRR